MGTPRPVALARELALLGADVVVVGSTARLLRGQAVDPADLDVSVSDECVPSLARALAALGSPVDAGRLSRGRCSRMATAWGPLDVFVGPAARASIDIDGVAVAVSA